MPKFCKNCGMVSKENDLFCKRCGTRLDDKYQNAVPAKHTGISVKPCMRTHSAICRIISILSVVELFIMLFVFGYMSNVVMTQKPLLELPLQRSIFADVFKGVLYGQKYWVGFCICLMAIFSIIVLSGISGIIGKRNKKVLYISASLNVFLLFILPFMSSGTYFGIGGVKLLLALSGMKVGACCMMLALVFLTIVLQCTVYLDFAMLKASKIRLILGMFICMAILVLPIYYLEDEIEFFRAMQYIGAFCWSKDNVRVSYLATIVGIMPILAGVCFCVIPNVFCEKGFAVMRSIIFGAVILIADFLMLSDISFIAEFIDDYILSVFAVVLLNAAIVWHIYLDLKNRGISVSNEHEW